MAIIGSGIGGLVAALRLASAGIGVVVYERAATPGGKMREVEVAGRRIDSGPTVLTMRSVFDEIFAEAGASFESCVRLQPLDVLARHHWTGGATLDLFSDEERSAAAIGALAGAREAQGYRDFCRRARRVYETLERPFIRASRPSLPELVHRIGPWRLGALTGISPFTTLSRALEGHFADPRLKQLFGRYATYCGSSPFLAPATLMLVAHVEREGVWAVEGGLYGIVTSLVRLAEAKGAVFRYGAEVRRVTTDRGGATGLALADGEVVAVDAVVANVDVGALAAGLLGDDVRAAAPRVRHTARSLSALTWSAVAEANGPALAHHNVFFSDDYAVEFGALRRGGLPDDPTVYICAPDRTAAGPGAAGPEPLFVIANAPPEGDRRLLAPQEISQCEAHVLRRLERCGLSLSLRSGSSVVTTPSDFARMFPGTGGALYGRASHGWTASFRRPGSRSRIPRLYLAGGSTHPGPGMPMAAISGMLAADSLVRDLASTRTSRLAATPGGTSTR